MTDTIAKYACFSASLPTPQHNQRINILDSIDYSNKHSKMVCAACTHHGKPNQLPVLAVRPP